MRPGVESYVKRIAVCGSSVLAVLILMASSPRAGGSGPQESGSCSVAPPYRVVTARADAVVSVRRYRDRFGDRIAKFRVCWKLTGRVTPLYRGRVSDSDEASAGNFVISGPYVAWSGRLDSTHHDGLSFIDVANAKAGTHPQQSNGEVEIAGETVLDTYVHALAVTRRGTTAWIAAGKTTEAVQARQLHHEVTTLDNGPLGTFAQLGFDGPSLTWQRAGQPQSAFVPAT